MEHEIQPNSRKNIKSALVREFTRKLEEKEGPSYNEYCYKKMKIASQAKMETDAIIEYTIEGINGEKMNKSILYGAKSICELERKLKYGKKI